MSSEDVPMDFDVEAVSLSVSLKVNGVDGSTLSINFERSNADSLDEVYDGFKGVMNTLVGFIDSRS